MTIKPEIIKNIFTKEGPKVSMFTKGTPDELKPKIRWVLVSSSIDGKC